jgi:hypothetical protein
MVSLEVVAVSWSILSTDTVSEPLPIHPCAEVAVIEYTVVEVGDATGLAIVESSKLPPGDHK